MSITVGSVFKTQLVSRPSVAQAKLLDSLFRRATPALWLGLSGIDLFNVDMAGSITGTVSAPALLKPSARVTLFSRSSMNRISSTGISSVSGFSFTGLDKSSNDYLAVATVPGEYNAIVYDKITPV